MHQTLPYVAEPLTEADGPIRLLWLHGWQSNRDALRPLANALLPLGESWLIDLPGHGQARLPEPDADASPAAMADELAAWLKTLPPFPLFVLGHSMGFRVAVQLAHRHPQLKVAGIVALAGAGVPRPLTFKQRLQRHKIRLLRRFIHALPERLKAPLLARWRHRYASADYKRCPEQLKPMFLQVVNDDVSPLLPSLNIPALLLYGALDEETPPALGERMAQLLPAAKLEILPGLNHYTILNQGRHLVGARIQEWLKALSGGNR